MILKVVILIEVIESNITIWIRQNIMIDFSVPSRISFMVATDFLTDNCIQSKDRHIMIMSSYSVHYKTLKYSISWVNLLWSHTCLYVLNIPWNTHIISTGWSNPWTNNHLNKHLTNKQPRLSSVLTILVLLWNFLKCQL